MGENALDDARELVQLIESLKFFPWSASEQGDSDETSPALAAAKEASLAKEAYTTNKVVGALTDLAERFSEHASRLQAVRGRHSNARLPCHRLPTEILSAIFSRLVPDVNAPASQDQATEISEYFASRKAIGAVCARWTQVLRSTSECWSTINYDPNFTPRQHDFLALSLRRAINIPVELSLTFDKGHTPTSRGMDTHVYPLFPHLARIRRCSVVVTSVSQLADFMPLLSRFTSLRHLRINSKPAKGESEQSRANEPISTLALQSFCYWDSLRMPFSINPSTLGDVSRLKYLRIALHSRRDDVPRALDCLTQLTSLEHLDLRIVMPSTHPLPEPRLVVFPKLKSLLLRSRAAVLFVPATAPCLEFLDLGEPSDQAMTLSPEWITNLRKYPHLRQLGVRVSDSFVDAIAEFISRSSTIVDVILDNHKTLSLDPTVRLLELVHRDVGVEWFHRTSPITPPRIHIQLKHLDDATVANFANTVAPAIQRLLARSSLQVISLRIPSKHRGYFEEQAAQYSGRILLAEHIESHLTIPPVFNVTHSPAKK